MRYISVFSGIEAASVAWEPLGWEPVAFSEIDPFPCAVLEERWPNVPNLGDITKVDWKEVLDEYGPVDVVVGGSPCQSFSIAGQRTSMDGPSALMWEYCRCVESLHPKWILWENVPGVLSTRDDAYGCLLRYLHECGYSLAWRVLDAQFVRVPVRDVHGRIIRWVGPVAQRRRRVFLVGHIGGGAAPFAVLFEREGMQGHPQSSREKRKALTAAAGRSPSESGGAGDVMCMQDGQAHGTIMDGTAPTLNAMHEQPIVIDRAAYNQGGRHSTPHTSSRRK